MRPPCGGVSRAQDANQQALPDLFFLTADLLEPLSNLSIASQFQRQHLLIIGGKGDLDKPVNGTTAGLKRRISIQRYPCIDSHDLPT